MSHLDAPEYQGPGRTQFHDAAIEHGLCDGPQDVPLTTDEHNTLVAQQVASTYSIERQAEIAANSNQLDELEDELDEDVMNRMRRQRIATLKQQQKHQTNASSATQSGECSKVQSIDELQFDAEVRVASQHGTVLVLIYRAAASEPHIDSLKMQQLLREFSTRHSEIKCVQMPHSVHLLHVPVSATPLLLAWRRQTCVKQWSNGALAPRASSSGVLSSSGVALIDVLEWKLSECDLCATQLTADPRDKAKQQARGGVRATVHNRDSSSSDDD